MEVNPVELVVDIADRFMHSTGERPKHIHASRGFKRMAQRYWQENCMPFVNADNPYITGDEAEVCGYRVRFDIPHDSIVVATP